MKLTKTYIKLKKFDFIKWWYVLFFIFFLPSFITRAVDIPYWGNLCYFIILLSDIYILGKRKKITLPTLWTIILYGYFLLITVINNLDDVFACMLRTFLAFSFVLTVEYIFIKYKTKKTISILLNSMEVFNYINLISMIIYPTGMYKVVTNGIYEEIVKVEIGAVRSEQRVLWLLGHQTLMIRFTLPAICIALIYIYLNGGKIRNNYRSIALIAVCLAETVIANSAGNYLILFVFLTFIILFHFRGKIKSWMIYPIIVAVYIFFLTSSSELNIFTLLSDIMNRSVKISTRIPIWLNTLAAWTEKPIFGWGYINENSTVIRQMLSLGNPHSSYLWALFEGGAVGLILLIIYLQKFAKKIQNCWNSKSAQIIYAAFISTMIAMIDDDYIFRFPQMLIIFILVFHIPAFKECELLKVRRS